MKVNGILIFLAKSNPDEIASCKKSCVSQSYFKLSAGIFYRSDISHFGKIPRCYCEFKEIMVTEEEQAKIVMASIVRITVKMCSV